MVNVAVSGSVTVMLDGCVVIVGGTGAAATVSVAGLLVTLPAVFVALHVNWAPVSASVVGGVAYEALVAPAMSTPSLCHW